MIEIADPRGKQYHRSVSQFNTYTRCSEQFRLERMVYPRLPKVPATWLLIGGVVHDVFEKYEKSLRTTDPDAAFEEAWERVVAEAEELQPDKTLWQKPPKSTIDNALKNAKATAKKQVENYVNHCREAKWEVLKINNEPAIEVEFELNLGGVAVVGYIDLIIKWPGKKPVVRDLKSGNRVVGNFQLGTYHLAAESLGVENSYGEYWYTKDGTSSGFKELSRYTTDYLTEIYGTLDQSIDRRLFLPNVGSHCAMCSVKDSCREMGSNPIPLQIGRHSGSES